jgi:hypothetical protein
MGRYGAWGVKVPLDGLRKGILADQAPVTVIDDPAKVSFVSERAI